MSRKGISGSSRQSAEHHLVSEQSFAHTPLRRPLIPKKFLGVSLGGGKTDKTCLALIEYYSDQNKVFLRHLGDKIFGDHSTSADEVLVQFIETIPKPLKYIALDTPLSLPKCMRCRLKCPGYEKCTQTEIQWLWKNYQKRNQKKKPKKIFTPYTERCIENYLASELEEEFLPQHALGSNKAPLTARALFLQNRLKSHKWIEVAPKVSLWRIGRALGIQKSYLRSYKHSVDGVEIREAILNQLTKRNVVFLYHQDMKTLIERAQAFDAFLCALTAVFKFNNKVEPRPKNFPKREAWIEIPVIEGF